MHTQNRIGVRQILAPATAVALIAGGIMARPAGEQTGGDSLASTASKAAVMVAGLLCPPEEVDVVLEGDYTQPLGQPSTYAWTEAAPGAVQYVSLAQEGQDGAYTVVIKDGKVTAKVNGKEIPDSRIKRDGDKITLLDEKGEKIATFGGGAAGKSFYGVVGEPRTMVMPGLRSAPLATGSVGQAQASPPKVMVGITMSEAPSGVLEGIVVDRVLEGLPASKAGLEAGDIIIELKGLDDVSPEGLRTVLRKKSPGDELQVRILRNGAVEERTIKLQSYDPEKLGVQASDDMARNAFRYQLAPGITGRGWRFESQEDVRKALEKAKEAIGSIDKKDVAEQVQKALDDAMRKVESQDWAKHFDGQFNIEIDPEVKWRFFTDDEGNAFTFPQAEAKGWPGTDDRMQELESRLDRLEEKIDRLEAAIQKLAGSR